MVRKYVCLQVLPVSTSPVQYSTYTKDTLNTYVRPAYTNYYMLTGVPTWLCRDVVLPQIFFLFFIYVISSPVHSLERCTQPAWIYYRQW